MSRTVLSQEQIEALPTGRSYQSLSATIPALSPAGSGRFDVGGASQMWQGTVVAYGSLANDTALEVDGMSVMTLLNQGSIAGVYHNQGAYQEMSYQVVAGTAESQTGGVRINMIPKEGGNRFSGDFLGMYSNEHFRSDNNDADLKAKGLTVAPSLRGIYDFNGGIGGPIVKNRIWFFHSTRRWGAANYIANQFFDNGDPGVRSQQAAGLHDPFDHPGESQEQAVGDVRRAAKIPRFLRQRDRTRDAGRHGQSGSVRLRRAGQVDVDAQQQAAFRGGILEELISATT